MEYVLDYSKWRSGGEDLWKVGIGATRMLNTEGYSCCLGQFAKQVGVDDDFLFIKIAPQDTANHAGLYDSNFVYKCNSGWYHNTELANELMRINDDSVKRPGERINSIRALLEKRGHALKVINAPDGIE